jgi:hypothetical protein
MGHVLIALNRARFLAQRAYNNKGELTDHLLYNYTWVMQALASGHTEAPYLMLLLHQEWGNLSSMKIWLEHITEENPYHAAAKATYELAAQNHIAPHRSLQTAQLPLERERIKEYNHTRREQLLGILNAFIQTRSPHYPDYERAVTKQLAIQYIYDSKAASRLKENVPGDEAFGILNGSPQSVKSTLMFERQTRKEQKKIR